MKGHNIIKGLSIVNRAIASSRLSLQASILPSTITASYHSLAPKIPNNSPSNPFGCTIRYYTKKATPRVDHKNIEMITLFPDNEEDFKIFKKIITNEGVVFTSSWIDQYFGILRLREYCVDFEAILKVAKKGSMMRVLVEKEELLEYSEGINSATQIALNHFFNDQANDRELKRLYEKMTSEASSDIGYYKFTDKNNGQFLGGGALAPLKKSDESGLVEEADVALHILRPKQGIGTACLYKLLNAAFEKHKIKRVWGTSIINHPGTPTLCARFGMMMRDMDNKKHYFIDDEMWRTNKGKLEIIENDTKSLANQYKLDNTGR